MGEKAKWYTNGENSIKCKLKDIPAGYVRNTNKSVWYTNGLEDSLRPIGIYTDGFYPGRTNGVGKSTAGKHWYNNGIESRNFYENEVPEGWVRGSLNKSTLGKVLITDGNVNKYISKEDELPEGFVIGSSEAVMELKASNAQKRKKVTYNNGIEEIRLALGDDVPDGFVAGKLTADIKKEARDKHYSELGYLPLKVLKDKYGLSWYVHLKDIDKIVLKEPYVYINKNEIPRIEEYISVNHSKGTSNFESDIAEYIKTVYNGKIERNVKSLLKDSDGKVYELDIYLPEKKLAIECNGIYWHSLSVLGDKNYHINKSKMCQELGIRLIHIYQSEWELSTFKVKQLLKIAVGCVDTRIYARKCEVRKIDNATAKKFSDKVHMQGHRNASVTYGLFYNNELVQLMSFMQTANARRNGAEWEIIRGCPGSNNIVVGGVSKLFKAFIKEYSPESVFSYCDFNKFDGKSYEALGMEFIGYTGPDMNWIVNRELIPRKPTEHSIMKSKAEDTLWGAGSKKYIWKRS